MTQKARYVSQPLANHHGIQLTPQLVVSGVMSHKSIFCTTITNVNMWSVLSFSRTFPETVCFGETKTTAKIFFLQNKEWICGRARQARCWIWWRIWDAVDHILFQMSKEHRKDAVKLYSVIQVCILLLMCSHCGIVHVYWEQVYDIQCLAVSGLGRYFLPLFHRLIFSLFSLGFMCAPEC